ncbi:MAG TPA: DUF3551 domain-containing protein [Burkholderiales bacterium]|jgi:hypothetical protein
MKTLLIVTAAATGALLAVVANAQTPVPANQRYCLEVRDASGSHPLLCRFATMEQCMASKASLGDVCLINPELTFQRR